MATCPSRFVCVPLTRTHNFAHLPACTTPPNSCFSVYVCTRARVPQTARVITPPHPHPSHHPPHSHAMAVCGRLPRPLWPPQSRAAFSVPRGLQRSRLAPDSHRVYVLCNCRPQSKQEAGVCQNELAFPPERGLNHIISRSPTTFPTIPPLCSELVPPPPPTHPNTPLFVGRKWWG